MESWSDFKQILAMKLGSLGTAKNLAAMRGRNMNWKRQTFRCVIFLRQYPYVSVLWVLVVWGLISYSQMYPKNKHVLHKCFPKSAKSGMLSAAVIESCNPKLIYFDQLAINYARVAASRFCCHVFLSCLYVLQEENKDSHLSGDHNPWLFGVGDWATKSI